MLETTIGPPADAELSLAALRYAAGEMTPADAEAFEARLADDQTARDALAEAVRLSAAASGAPAPSPDPLVRQAVAERLHPTLLSRLFPRRPYRGHPMAWAGLGGGVAAAVAVTVALGGVDRTDVPVEVSYQTPADVQMMPIRPVGGPFVVPVTDEPPMRSKLNPMGMERRATDTADAGPSPMVLPPVVPAVMPAPRPADDKIAEGLNDPNPMMGDPAVGALMSKL